MPAPSRNEVAEKHRVQRRESSPYNQRGRKEKMAASRGWRPTIWKALTFWRGANDEDSDPEEDVSEPYVAENGNDAGAEERAVEDGNDADSLSVMNSSIVSEDQVRQLISPTPRQVRFQLPSPSHNSRRISPPQPGSSTPFIFPRQQPYVAPLPPSSSFIKTDEDPLVKVSQYLDNVVRPRGGNCTEMEALGLSMLIQSAVKGSNSANSTPSRDVSPHRKPFVFPTPDTPLKPTFTAPNTNFAAIFSKPDSINTSTTTKSASPSRPLTRNPNGNVMFQGGGSAKSRYRSPAFGTPSPRKRIAFPPDFGGNKAGNGNGNGISNSTPSVNDGKRRRIDEESNSSVTQSSGSSFQTTTSSSSLDSQTKANGNGTALHNGHGTAGPSRAQPSTSAPLRLGGSSRFSATTPVRPSPLRQSMRADSSSPGSPSSNRSTPEAKSINIAKQSQAKAVAIMAEIIQSASQPKNEQISSLNADISNPYDTRPASKRARRATKPARPPPRPARRAVSAEIPPPPEPPRKPTALETIEQTAPMSVQAQSKRVHAEMVGLSQSSKPKPKRPSPVNHDVIEIDDEEEEEPPTKRARPETTKPTMEPIKEFMEVIDVDGDVDMATSAPTSTANVLRPSEIIEPTDAEMSDSSKSAASRALYPTSLSKVSGGFGVAPKKPSPLRNSFQPELDSSNTTPKPKPFEATTTPSVFGSTFTSGSTAAPAFSSTLSNDESSKVSAGSTSFTSTSTSTATSLFGTGSSFASSNTSFSSTFSTAAFGASSTEDKIIATAPNTNGFTFGPTAEFSSGNTTSSQTVTKPYQFGSSPSTSTFIAPTKVENGEAAIKKAVLAIDAFTLPVFRFTRPVAVMDDYFAERNAALALPMKSLPKFTFDMNAVPKSTSAPAVPSTSEVKVFNWTAAGMNAPSPSGWTCSVCSVPNKKSDSKCVCCGENAPAPPKTETKSFDWLAAGVKAPVSSGWTCSLCSVPNKVSDSKCVCCGENKP